FSSRRRHTRWPRDWSSDVCSSDLCAEKGGKVEKTEQWGTRKLAYRVHKHREGIYVHQEIRTTHGELIAEIERRLRTQDAVIKYQTVRLDEDLKRQKKLSLKREKRSEERRVGKECRYGWWGD